MYASTGIILICRQTWKQSCMQFTFRTSVSIGRSIIASLFHFKWDFSYNTTVAYSDSRREIGIFVMSVRVKRLFNRYSTAQCRRRQSRTAPPPSDVRCVYESSLREVYETSPPGGEAAVTTVRCLVYCFGKTPDCPLGPLQLEVTTSPSAVGY